MDARPVGLEPRALPLQLLWSWEPKPDYVDAFGVALPRPIETEEAARLLFSGGPRWMGWLMALRNRVVAQLGLRVVAEGARPGLPFEVRGRSPDELLLGEDDRHLDFRVSVLRHDGGMVVATAVRQHNRLGRAYFAVVRPFHRVLVRSLLARLRERVAQGDAA